MKRIYKSRLRVIPFLFVSVMTASCSVHDIDEQPNTEVEVPAKFSIETEEAVFNQPWWQSFDREALNELIESSLSKNYDVAQSVAVLEQVQAIIPQTESQQLPQIGIEGGYDRQFQGNTFSGNSLDVSAALSWELDFWGRIASAAKADRLEARARAADVEAVKLSLSAEVANAYFGAVSSHTLISLLKEQLSLDQKLEDILKLRVENGVSAGVEVLQQKARVADSATLIPNAESELAVFENRLDVLLGEVPDGKLRVSDSDNLIFSEDLPKIGVPSALLLNRPDLLAARNDLVAADADIGAAIADRLPSFTLTGNYGYEDSDSVVGPVSSLALGFVQPLLDWGQRKAEVERNEALYNERLAAYTQLFLEAVEQVENALVQEKKQREFLQRLDTQRTILQEVADGTEERYKQGVDDYQPVIDALQELRDVQRDLVTEELALVNIRIDLFRAIGGPIYAKNEEGKQDEPN